MYLPSFIRRLFFAESEFELLFEVRFVLDRYGPKWS